jgi:hypothetical protein
MPIRPELRSYYGAEWRKYRQFLIDLAGDKCTICGIELAEGLHGCHVSHDPRDAASVQIMCPSCHAHHDAPHRLAMWRRSRAARQGQMWLDPAIEWAPYPIWQIPDEALAEIQAQARLKFPEQPEGNTTP